jgi:hypothetical protein
LYPYGVYSSNTSKTYLHFNLDLNKWCANKALIDYNSIYNLDNININIDGYNICNRNDGSCYDVGNKKTNSENIHDNCGCKKTNSENIHDNCGCQKNKSENIHDNCGCKKIKCKTGMCKNAKPLFISTFEKG